MDDWQWLWPTIPATVSAVAAVALYLHHRAPRWDATQLESGEVVFTYDGYATIRDVVVAIGPVANWGTEERERLSRGGKIRVNWIGGFDIAPDTATVTWRGWFGRRRTWTSGL